MQCSDPVLETPQDPMSGGPLIFGAASHEAHDPSLSCADLGSALTSAFPYTARKLCTLTLIRVPVAYGFSANASCSF